MTRRIIIENRGPGSVPHARPESIAEMQNRFQPIIENLEEQRTLTSLSSTAIVSTFIFEGTTWYIAISAGVQGWELIDSGTVASTVITSALNYLPLTGGKIYVSEGIYIITATIIIPIDNCSLLGFGPATVFRATTDIRLIVADTRDNVVIGDLQVDGMDGAVTQEGICLLTCTNSLVYNVESIESYIGIHFFNTDNSEIIDCRCFDNINDGIRLASGSDENLVTGCHADTNGNFGVNIYQSHNNRILGNHCEENTRLGIELETSNYNILSDNTCLSNTESGIDIWIGTFNIVEGNECNDNGQDGIHINPGGVETIVTANICRNNDDTGIAIDGDRNNVVSNIVSLSGNHGITVYGANGNVVLGNQSFTNSQSVANTFDGIAVYNGSNYNIVDGNQCYDNRFGVSVSASGYNILDGNFCFDNNTDGIRLDTNADLNSVFNNHCINNTAYGINISNANCNNNRIINNFYSGNGTAPIQDLGTDTNLETIPLYIVSYNGVALEDGIEIDLAGEWASFVGQLPLCVQQVVRFEVWGIGLAAPGAGNQMCLEIEIEGGADDEALNQHDTGALAGQLNTTENTAINDVIHWVCTHANALALLGGDSVKCVVRYNVAVGADIATDAAFRRVLVHVV